MLPAVMFIYFNLLEEGGCYSCFSNNLNALFSKHAQSIVYSVTNKQYAYSLLECTTIV